MSNIIQFDMLKKIELYILRYIFGEGCQLFTLNTH